jgi:hypothetical protein
MAILNTYLKKINKLLPVFGAIPILQINNQACAG